MKAAKHTIKSGAEYDKFFPQPSYEDKIVMKDASVHDTARFIQKVVLSTLDQTEEIAKELKHSNLYVTCQKIFDFVYNHIQYNEDAADREQVHSPARIWQKRKIGVDCDDMTVFISSILMNMGIPHILRMAGYGSGFQHIYVVVPTDRREIIIDPVVDTFNYEKRFNEKKDFPMKLEYLGKVSNEGDVVKCKCSTNQEGELGDTASDLLATGTQFVSAQTSNGTTAAGQAVSDALGQISTQIKKGNEAGKPINWEKITGIALAVGCAAIGQCFGIPAPVGAFIGMLINKGIYWLIKIFTKERKAPSGWMFNPEDPAHKEFIMYMIDAVMMFNNHYFSWMIAVWNENVRQPENSSVHPGKTPQEFYENFDEFVARNIIWLTDQNKVNTPLDPKTKLDFEDWKNKTGNWSMILLWYAYQRDRIMITDEKLFIKLINEANDKKVAFSTHIAAYVRSIFYSGLKAYPPGQLPSTHSADNLVDIPAKFAYRLNFNSDEFGCWLMGTKYQYTSGDRNADYQFFPYTIQQPIRREPIGVFQFNALDPEIFAYAAYIYDRNMKLPKGHPQAIGDGAGGLARDGYIADAKARNKTVMYVIFQNIGERMQQDSKNTGVLPNIKQYFIDRAKDINDWKTGTGSWAGYKPTKLVKTEEGQYFVYDSGAFPNPDEWAPKQEIWTESIISTAAAAGQQSSTSMTTTAPQDPKLPTDPNAPVPPAAPQTFWEKTKAWVKEHPYLTTGIVVTAAGGVGYGIYRYTRPKKPKTPKTKESLSGVKKQSAKRKSKSNPPVIKFE